MSGYDPINNVGWDELNPPLQDIINSKASKDELQNEADLRAAGDKALSLIINNNAGNMDGSGGSVINKHIIVKHGELIPLPAGYTEAQCQWGIEGAVPRSGPGFGIANYYTPNVLSVSASSRVVTAQYHWIASGQNNHDITVNCAAYCWISGTKPFTPNDTIPKALAKEVQDRINGDNAIWDAIANLVNEDKRLDAKINSEVSRLETKISSMVTDPCAGACKYGCTGACGQQCYGTCVEECRSGCSSR